MKYESITSYVTGRVKTIGEKLLYAVLLLYHAYKREETPFWAKNIIIASIAYFLSPFDAIPDLTPFLGFTDDISVIMFGVVSVACFINQDVRQKARNSLATLCKSFDEKVLDEVDEKL